MGTWNSRGLRGSTLEDLINRTNERYDELDLALIQKIPTPITPVQIDKERRHITLAYLTRSVRWITSDLCRGFRSVLMQRNAVADTFPLQNIHEHQMRFMEKYEKQGGVFFSRHLLQCKEYSFIICVFVKSSVFGSGESRAAGRVSGWKNWTSGILCI